MIGVYILRHVLTSLFYIGSTSDFTARQYRHMSEMKLGTHPSKQLINAFQLAPEFTWEFIPTNTYSEAFSLEQSLIREHFGNPNIANTHYAKPMAQVQRTNIANTKLGSTHSLETINKMSVTRKGVPKTKEHMDKINASRQVGIIVDGKYFPSATEAAKAYNTSPTTVLHRAKNISPKFSNWQLA